MIPKITVLGVGGAGGNAINNMISLELQGVSFVVANTDAQALSHSKAGIKIQLGEDLTKGLGAGSSPEIGSQAVEESKDEILAQLGDSNMVFITAGMGGGTGTGAAPNIAKLCREAGILTVGVITKPFHFEGSFRMKAAELGVAEMQKHVDTLICIPNQNLFHRANEQTTFAEAFSMVDDILYSGIKGVTDLMTMPGLINLDFADIRAIMGGMGKAMMGTGEAGGEKRALEAAESAISNPLLDNASMQGAKGVLINISGGLDMTLFEADEAAQRIKDEVDPDANIIFGSTFDKELDGKIRVSVVATGIDLVSGHNNSYDLNLQTERNLQAEQPKTNKFAPQNKENLAKSQANNANDKALAQLDVDKAFIPPQIVDPVSLQQHQLAEDDCVPAEEDIAVNKEQNNLAEFAQVDLTTQAGQSQSVSLSEKQTNLAEQQNQNYAKNAQNVDRKPKSGFSSIFSFFKDSREADNINQSASVANDDADSDQENSDLVLSEDILNVPTFLRNKEGGSK